MAKYGVWKFVKVDANDVITRFEVVSTSGKSAKVIASAQGGAILSMKKVCDLNGFDPVVIGAGLQGHICAESAERIMQVLDLCGLFDVVECPECEGVACPEAFDE